MKLRLFRFLGLCLVMLGIIALTPSPGHAAFLEVHLHWDPSIDQPYMGNYKIYWEVGSSWTFTNVTDFGPPGAAYDATAYSTNGSDWTTFPTPQAPPVENISKDATDYWLRFPDDSVDYNFAMTSVDTQGLESNNFSNVVSSFFSVNGVSPNKGVVNGGNVVTISGGGFLAGATVTFGGDAATGVTVTPYSMITCTTPASTLGGDGTGSVDVAVTNDPGGPNESTQTLTNGYEYSYIFGITQPALLPVSVQAGDVVNFDAEGSISGNYQWTFNGGTPLTANTKQVVWTAPTSVSASPTAYNVELVDPIHPGVLKGSGVINVYPTLMVANKPAETPTVEAGAQSNTYTVEGGDPTLYTWTLTDSAGNTVDTQTGASYSFTAPSAGAFAGVYTVEVTDNQGFQDSFQVKVPFKVDPDSKSFTETQLDGSANPQNFTVTGANGNYTWEILDSATATDQVTNPADYGAWTTTSPVIGNTNTFTPAHVNQITTFYIRVTVSGDPDLTAVNGLNRKVTGPFRIIPVKAYSGYVEDINGTGQNSATVAVVLPGAYQSSTQTVTDPATARDGYFTFNLPDTGTVYYLRASKDGFVTKTFTSADLMADNTIVLEAAAANAYFSGNVTLTGVPTAADVQALYQDANGNTVVAGLTQSDAATGYRIDLAPEHAGAFDYTLAASKPGYSGSLNIGIPSFPVLNANIAMAALPTDSIDAVFGGSSTQTVGGMPAVQIPAGAVDTSGGAITITSVKITVNTIPNDQKSNDTMASGPLLYVITAQDQAGNPITTFLTPITVTIAFDLSVVAPGDLESGRYVIRHAATQADLVNNTNVKRVRPGNIISVDYVGNGQSGYATIRVSSLSVFGVGGGAGGAVYGGGGGGCFIATAAYGTPFSEKVKILDQFRDVYLLPTKIGRDFVAFYYAHSPPLANYIAKRDGLRTLVRVMLTPVIGVCYVALHTNMTQKIMIFIGILLLLGAGLIALRNRIHRKRMSS